jgi:pyruvate kinase
MLRRTRIVATLGPATDRNGVLEKLIEAGLDVARINFSHGTGEEHVRRIRQLREIARSLGRTVAVLADLPGPKLRVLTSQPMELTLGRVVTVALKPGAEADIRLTEPDALAKIKTGQRVLLDDGRLQAKVGHVTSESAALTITVAGALLPNKGINLPDTELNIPAVTKRDREAIAVAAEAGVDWFGLSFVRNAAAAPELRGVLRGHGLEAPILAKIERPEAVRKADEIIDAFDGVMVARGDLGVEIPLEKVPHVQKHLIHQARMAGKPVVTATDMLDSMRNSPRPTRAEASDVANAVYDGTDAVMLSGETAIGAYPVEALACMANILREAESHTHDDGPRNLQVPKGDLTDHLTHMTCKLAHDIHAEAIVTPTSTGRTARLIARHRPPQRIVPVCPAEDVVRQTVLTWGCQPVPFAGPVAKGDDRMSAAVRAAFAGGQVHSGALVVVLAGHPIEGGEGFPTIRVVRVGDDGQSCEP